MKVIFINRYFHPDYSATSQMLTDLAFRLARRGYSVTVITSRQRYDDPSVQLPAQESIGGVEVLRVRTSRFGRSRLLGRAIDYATFYASAGLALWREAQRGDITVAMTDPPMLSLLAAPIARSRGARLINWLQDVFPEVAESLGVGHGRLTAAGYGLLRLLRNLSLRMADMNVAIGERMAARLEATGIPRSLVTIISNWADGALIRPIQPTENAFRQAWGLADAFVVGYSGNLGRAHDIETILGAIATVEQENTAQGSPRVVWLFIGGGAQLATLRREAEARGLSSLRFEAYQQRERLAESLSVADVHLVSLRPELEGLIVPSKVYGIAAAGRPAIFIGDRHGEIATLLAAHGCGVTVDMGDSAGLARAVLELAANREICREMGARGRAALLSNYDVSVAVEKWATLMDFVAGSDAPSLASSPVTEQ